MTNERTEAPVRDSSALALTVHPALRRHFARPHVGFVDVSWGQRSWSEYPSGMVTIIVNVGDAFGGHPAAFVAGLTQSPDVITQDGPIECLDVKLTPPGARRLLGMPVEELTGSLVAIEEVLGPSGAHLHELIAAQPTWTGRAGTLDAALLRHGLDLPGVDRRVEWARRRIVARRGLVSIQKLASEVGWSQRHFIRTFRRELGLTPHKLARVSRFNAVLPALRDGRPDRAGLAARYGYADQSHLIREVREFAGVTPTSLAASGPR